MLLYLDTGGHGDCSIKLFGSHKGFYDSQWPLTDRYFKSWKIVCSVKVSKLELFIYPLQTNYSQIFRNCLCVEQRITKLDWKNTMYIVVKCPWILIFILLCLIFSRFLILFIYIINISYWQVLFIISENRTLQLSLLNSGGILQLYLFSNKLLVIL